MIGRVSLAALLALLAPLAAAALLPVVEPGQDLALGGDLQDDSAPVLAFLPGGDLLQVSAGLWDEDSCFRGWAPCTGPLQATVIDRFEPTITRPFPVEPDEPHWPEEVAIARGAGDSFLVVWHERPYCNIRFGTCAGDDGIEARFFLHPGVPGGPVLLVAAEAAGEPMHPAVATLQGGGFVVVWQSAGAGAATASLVAQRFDAAGNPLGGALLVAAGATPGETPAVAAGDGGSFLVAWTRPGTSAGAAAGASPSLFARLFAADGSPTGGETRMDDGATGSTDHPALAPLAGGGFALVWSGEPSAVWTRRLDASGTPMAAPVRASDAALEPADASGGPPEPSVASDATGGFLVIWQRRGTVFKLGPVTAVLGTYFAPAADPLREQGIAGSIGYATRGPRLTSDGAYEYAVVRQGPLLSSPAGFPPTHVYAVERAMVPGAPCAAGAGALCLGGRFRVETRWRDQHGGGTLGYGTAVPFSAATGLFWFFDSGNVELVVKVLDGTSLNHAFWFFYGALSDVEYWIRATDTATGRVTLYHNPPDQLCGSANTTAFPQLPADAAVAGLALPSDRASDRTSGRANGQASRQAAVFAAPSASLSPAATCAADATTLCLLGGRFAVRVDWRDQHGHGAGAGQALPWSDATGFFWFFDSGNVELAVKVLDGRAVDGKFWVFYGGLSDVEYTVHVTDTATGAVRDYHNAPNDYCGRADTLAF